jgi:hypothetical protein
MFIKILEPEHPLWQRVLLMEIFRGVCGDSTLLRSIYRWYDRAEHSTNVFQDMINAFGKLAAERPQALGVGVNSTIGHVHQSRESLDISGIGGMGGDVGGLSIANSTMKVQWYVSPSLFTLRDSSHVNNHFAT